MEFLEIFRNHSEYEARKTSGFVASHISHCIKEVELHYDSWSWTDVHFTFVAIEDGTFKFVGNAVNYSLDNGKTWTSLPSNTDSPIVKSSKKILWKANLTPKQGNPIWGIGTFSSSNKFYAEGNPLSLIYGDNAKTNNTSIDGKKNIFDCLFQNCKNIIDAKNVSLPSTALTNNCYSHMFEGCTSLKTTPELPATVLAKECYNGMFQGCTSLTKAPQLPAMTLAQQCYYYMFDGCTSLTKAPELPATTLAQKCYYNMFYNCTSLILPPELPATTLEDYCYYRMFEGCTNLKETPELPATTLANWCYGGMFAYCSSITKAPELPATELKERCYTYLFYYCTSLTKAPDLIAKTLVNECYYFMFNGCANLNYIKAMFTTKPTNTYTDEWVEGVAENGTFVKNAAATWNVRGITGIPSGWNVETASE